EGARADTKLYDALSVHCGRMLTDALSEKSKRCAVGPQVGCATVTADVAFRALVSAVFTGQLPRASERPAQDAAHGHPVRAQRGDPKVALNSSRSRWVVLTCSASTRGFPSWATPRGVRPAPTSPAARWPGPAATPGARRPRRPAGGTQHAAVLVPGD